MASRLRNAEAGINLIIMVSFMAAFLGLFFFTYAARIEREITLRQVQYLVGSLTAPLNATMTPLQAMTLQQSLRSVDVNNPQMQAADRRVRANNQALLAKATRLLGGFLAVGVGVAYGLSRQFGVDFGQVLRKNLLLMVFVALAEFTFATFFATQFISADANQLKAQLVKIASAKSTANNQPTQWPLDAAPSAQRENLI